ncbi:MAG: rod shape-determining protein RodA [Algoriphagus sp.]|jgi:rod shape determining protein RodA|uniref:rod shape-determining protein RodA n=1 Tax=Algoriphagus sp. TaxID=1872435 RepID=UPI0027692319|nr:rod shape-determining protein RodA [Algoriphagus sp.]MDP4747137.1 rod shape-determining protein RodA [Algoriphagus sp.]MDP4838656.1 rod shape-determining protein RodA [Algoriphagus sp.]MDP4904130.1 rod shape-determining protein RodA [Algoriphagus sp.]MDP4957975.1 rod shape-determining protein RodA [Algoriphagus sp.]
MKETDVQINRVDWIAVSIYFALVMIGWFNIYAVVYDSQVEKSIFDFSISSGKQLMWIGTSIGLITLIMVADYRFFENLSLVIYLLFLLILVLTPFFGKEVNGQILSIGVGEFRIQPGEFAKFATALALAKVMERPTFDLSKRNYQFIAFGVLLVPIGLILLQPDTGTAMVYFSFLLMFYREGLPQWYYGVGIGAIAITLLALGVDNNLYLAAFIVAIIGTLIYLGKKSWQRILAFSLIGIGLIAYIYSIDFVVSKLPAHQQNRVMVLFNPEIDPLGVGWNVTQSKIAIGSGGLFGKGYLEGTQTKFDFVPEQDTDFIFCTLGEEFGWFGSLVVIGLFAGLLYRLVIMAERQKTRFSRIYGYGVISILLFHFMINISMTIGLFPVVGIPLPFFSYGGSSLWSFTILLFIFIKLDSSRASQLGRIN